MADLGSRRRRRKQPVIAPDEFGGTPDGGLTIITGDDDVVHRTPPRVAASLRYFLAKSAGRGDDGFPDRLAITSPLRGDGVTFTTRSIASVLAYDSDSTVAIIDLNWTGPPREVGKGRKSRRGKSSTATATPAAAPIRSNDGGGSVDTQRGTRPIDEPDDSPETGDDDVQSGADRPADSVATRQTSRQRRRSSARSGNRVAGTARPALPEQRTTIRFESPDGRPAALIDAIEGRASIDDIIVATTNPRLSLVHAGELPLARRPAVAASASLQTVIDDVAARFDHIVLDLPPVLASSDAIRLAQLADSFALVVRHGVTTTRQVEAALDELASVPPMGVILNRYATRIPLFLRRLVGA
jgi:Mrp family chromosome partitioning ATPase